MEKKQSVSINMLLNVFKQLMAILFPMITVYYASRILGNEEFGKVNYIRSIVSYFALLAALGISTYGVRDGSLIRSQKSEYNSFAASIYTINVVSTVIALALFGVLCLIPGFEIIKIDKHIAIIFSTSIILQTIGAEWINTTFEDFKFIAIRYLFCNICALVFLFLFVKQPKDSCLYAMILVLATYGGNILNIFHIKKYTRLHLVPIKQCKKFLKPIFILFFTELATSIYINSDMTMLGLYIGNESVGIYTISANIYTAVKHLSNAAITVTLPRLTSYIGLNELDKYRKSLNKIINYSIVLLLPIVVGLFVLSRKLVIFMGGISYEMGYSSLSILSIALLFAVGAFIISRCVLLPYKRDKTYFIATFIGALLNVVLNLWAIPRYSFDGAAFTTLLSEIVVFFIMVNDAKRVMSLTIRFSEIIKSIIASAFVVLTCEIVKLLFQNNITTIVVSFLSSAIIYFVSMFLMKSELIVKMFSIIQKRFRMGNSE